MEKKARIQEGRIVKGGRNDPPTTPRPNPPAAAPKKQPVPTKLKISPEN